MKESKKSKRKRSQSLSQSSKDKRDRSPSSSSQKKHKQKHKSKKSRDHKKHPSRSIERQTSRHQANKSRDIKEQRNINPPQEKYTSIPKQQPPSSKHEDIKLSPQSRYMLPQNPQVKPQKQLPCFEPSGILLQYYNARQGVSLRFHQPPQSRQPDQQWRMYIFKGEQVLQPITLEKSSYLIGKDQRVADILTQNPSISRQHAVVQFRLVQKRQTQGQFTEEVKPYVMDLESTNGTLLNDEKIQPGRYYELLHRDVLKFGFSDREYVMVKWEQNQSQAQEE